MLGSGLSMTGSVLSVNASTAVPPATSSSLGTVQLAGSLTGSAIAPSLATNSVGSSQISPGAVGATQLGANVVGNGQLAPLSGPSELIGSNSSSPAASNITLGTGLMASNSIGSAQIIAGSVGATQLGANVVGTGQLAPLSANSELLGSNSSSPAATNITLGSGLSMTGSVLSVNASTAVPAATSSSLGTIQLAGALTGSATAPTLATGSVGATQIVAGSVGATQLGANVVGNGQLAPLSAPSELIGSNSASPNATNISLGSGFLGCK